MTDDREPFREAREHGLKARHEQRLENATYTAAEVKVLTEAALRLGRAEVVDELRALAVARREYAPKSVREEHATASLLADILDGTVDPLTCGWKERTA